MDYKDIEIGYYVLNWCCDFSEASGREACLSAKERDDKIEALKANHGSDLEFDECIIPPKIKVSVVKDSLKEILNDIDSRRYVLDEDDTNLRMLKTLIFDVFEPILEGNHEVK